MSPDKYARQREKEDWECVQVKYQLCSTPNLYVVVRFPLDKLFELQKEVNILISNGYKPSGGLTSINEEGKNYLYQVVTQRRGIFD